MTDHPLPVRTLVVAALLATSCLAPRAAQGRIPLQSQRGAYELEVLVDGRPAPTFAHAGETYAMGRVGARYTLRVSNRSPRRIEAVVSVDGRDVIDGKPADFRSKRGYLVPAWGSVEIDGWRLSQAQVAAFRFAPVADSYAARTGSAREVGVIGVAVFPERFVPPPRALEMPAPFPYADAAEGARGAGAPPRAGKSAAPVEESAGEAPLADRAAPARSERPRSRPGLGTEFGEAVSSAVHDVPFERANAGRPAVVLGLRYDDRAGLLAMGVDVDGTARFSEAELRQSAEPFPVVDRGYATPPSGWRSSCCVR